MSQLATGGKRGKQTKTTIDGRGGCKGASDLIHFTWTRVPVGKASGNVIYMFLNH